MDLYKHVGTWSVYIQIHMRVAVICLLLLAVAICQDDGARRVQELRELSRKASNGIISFNSKMFNEYAQKFPRPYDLVIYFTSQNCRLCMDLQPDYEYLATLYSKAGVTQQSKHPVFFADMTFSTENREIYKIFEFNTAPNLAVLKPKFATLSSTALPSYLKGFIWAISHTDGHVTTHKMLDFVNKRTGVDVIYKPTLGMMLTTISVFLLVAAVGVLAYTKLKFFWMRWQVWFGGVLLIYITCVSGVVYDIIMDVPFVSRDDKGNAVIFSTGGSRYQNGAEGLVVSLTIASIGILIILIPKVFSHMERSKARLVSIGILVGVYALVKFLEEVYRMKSWYNPSYNPPGDYQFGSFMHDQGNNI